MATKMRQKKYLQHELMSDHYYQNQNTTKPKTAKSKTNTKTMIKSDSQIGSTTASTSSSNRMLINDDETSDSDIAFCFLTLAIFCLVFSVIAIAITFIFPFWFRLTIKNPDSISYINVTNVDNNLTLFAQSTSSSDNATTIFIDMGIWEVKMNQEIDIIDSSNLKKYKNSYPQSMLWLNSDDLFLESFIKFINLKMSNLFVVQTLEILHLIFTFLTFTFTSFTVCLTGQANANKSLCWYFVCFIMALVAFLSGLAVVILIMAWQSVNSSWLRDETGKQFLIRKELGWTFWTSVGILSLILLAGFLILIHILIQSLISYFRNRKRSKNMKKNSNKNNKMNYFNGLVASNPNITNDVFQANNQQYRNSGSNYSNLNNSKYPRLQPGTTTANYPAPPLSLLPINNNNNSARNSKLENLSFRQNNNTNGVEQFINESQQFNSPSYIFYTGHGQYRKQSISAIDQSDEKQIQTQTRQQQQQPLEYEFANEILVAHPPNSLNYSMGLNTTGSNYKNPNHSSNEHHPYSNVIDNHHQSHLHMASNQLNPNELTRYFR